MQATTDSHVASRFVAALGYRRGLCAARPGPPVAVVVHTTGGGVVARYLREGARKGDATPFDTGVRIYTTIMEDSAHYVVGQAGECVQVVPESLAARHVGGSGSVVYARPQSQWMTSGLGWWGDRWPDLATPYELAGGQLWRGGSCNRSTVGVEVVPPLSGARGAWSPECWAALAALVSDVCARHGIPADREHIVTHSDAHPASRSAKGAPWDPGPGSWSWDRMAAALAVHARA